MLIEGSKGSLNVYVNDILTSSFPLSKKRNLKWYQDSAEKAMIVGMRNENIKLSTMIIVFHEVIELNYLKQINYKRMSSEDHQLLLMAVLSLIKLKQIEFDDYILMMNKKKKKSFIKKII